jgi:hypothetical protein
MAEFGGERTIRTERLAPDQVRITAGESSILFCLFDGQVIKAQSLLTQDVSDVWVGRAQELANEEFRKTTGC